MFASMPENNPFLNREMTTGAEARYPSVESLSPEPDGSQFTSWMQPGSRIQSNGQLSTQIPPSSTPSATQFGGVTGTVAPYDASSSSFAPVQPFQPTGLSAAPIGSSSLMTGSPYNYIDYSAPSQTALAYRPAQEQLQNPGYVAQFDPYAATGNGWDSQPQGTQSSIPSSNQPFPFTTTSPIQTSPTGTTTSPTGEPHPRAYIRSHRAEIEAWDPYSWKQFMNTFDALKSAWNSRKRDLGNRCAELQTQVYQQAQYHGYMYVQQMQPEVDRLQTLEKQAESNVDSVTACSFQIREAYEGYRLSGDFASKRRVRESANAALQGLPEWPTSTF
ncbi:hypothetical protein FISHEDRAFT_77904 [Fistulina hepatica ATCC 64428]|nr:hypothetical protein FISHEDRAFT_77904 [Fistulina hepatica ATCC 64428]